MQNVDVFPETEDVHMTEVDKRVTTKYMTKYERARVIGARAHQLSMNARPMVDPGAETDALRIAEKELSMGRLPMIVRRFLPDGTHEDWHACELLLSLKCIN